jgi:multiple sugar transport system permease protein
VGKNGRRNRKRMVVRAGRQVTLNLVGVLIFAVLLFPIYWTVCVAFENDPDPLVTAPRLLPLHPVFSNFVSAFNVEHEDILTSLIVSCAAVGLGLLVAIPAAYALRRFRVRYTAIVIGILLVTQMVPSISLSIAFYTLFKDIHVLNSYGSLILADSTYVVPLMVLLLRAFLESVPTELLEAARLDGATELRCMMSVVVPMSVPGIITASLFGFLGAWGDFVFGLTLNAGSSVQPMTLGLYRFFTQYSASWGPIMATVVLAAVPAALILSLGMRWVRSGLRAGALQG